MNNDFNYKPRESQPAASPAPTSAETSSNLTDTEAPAPAVESSNSVVTSPKNSSGAGKKLLSVLGVVLLLALAAGGVYEWQQQKVTSAVTAQSTAQSQVTSLQSQLAKQKAAASTQSTSATAAAAAQPVTSTDVVTGTLVSQTSGTAKLNADYLPGKVTEVWIEYGTKPATLSSTTTHTKVASQSGTSYVAVPFDVTGLTVGTQYFYRAAGTVDGKTVYGGVVTFAATK